jgi:hypothetical protein
MLAAWLGWERSESSWASFVVLHALATWFLVGMIWTVQYVHYPLFANVGAENYVEFQAEHVSRIGVVLAVPWIAEGVATLGLLMFARRGRELVVVSLGAAAAAAVLVISGFVSAPAHGALADGFETVVHERLLDWNLVRSLLWSFKGGVAAALLWWLVRPEVRTTAVRAPVFPRPSR